jgi:uncharacterized protein DUF3306
MNDRENFIARWSRRKRAATDDADATKIPAAPAAADESAGESEHASSDARAKSVATSAQGATPELTCDLTKLPPIESIGAETDIRGFLAPGVPPELTRAALRRAWAADPKVRDFVGLADYDWDFNTPGAIPGFGPLEMTDELRRQVAQMVGRSLAAGEPEKAAATAAEGQGGSAAVEASAESGATTPESPSQQAQSNRGASQVESVNPEVESHNLLQCGQDHTAAQYNTAKPDNADLIVKRPHGRALPK